MPAIRNHGPEKKHCCDFEECHSSFDRLSDLKRHKGIHLPREERSFTCKYPGCEYRSNQKSNVATHERSIHLKERHPCSEPGCKKTYSDPASLSRHRSSCHGSQSGKDSESVQASVPIAGPSKQKPARLGTRGVHISVVRHINEHSNTTGADLQQFGAFRIEETPGTFSTFASDYAPPTPANASSDESDLTEFSETEFSRSGPSASPSVSSKEGSYHAPGTPSDLVESLPISNDRTVLSATHHPYLLRYDEACSPGEKIDFNLLLGDDYEKFTNINPHITVTDDDFRNKCNTTLDMFNFDSYFLNTPSSAECVNLSSSSDAVDDISNFFEFTASDFELANAGGFDLSNGSINLHSLAPLAPVSPPDASLDYAFPQTAVTATETPMVFQPTEDIDFATFMDINDNSANDGWLLNGQYNGKYYNPMVPVPSAPLGISPPLGPINSNEELYHFWSACPTNHFSPSHFLPSHFPPSHFPPSHFPI